MKSSKNLVIVFVPSTGYLYFYFDFLNMYTRATLFSSPLRGISISTGILSLIAIAGIVFVPSTGYLYFYECPDRSKSNTTDSRNCFRPLYGVSLFLPFLVFPLKIQRELSGLRCKRTNQIISCS